MMVWSSCTAYEKLYSPEYFGKNSGVASFSSDGLPLQLQVFCKESGIANVVDVGSGSGLLAAMLKNGGIGVISCDYQPAHEDCINFDLTSRDQDEVGSACDRVKNWADANPYLVTCLDVLEHIDCEDLEYALHNLWQITGDFGIFSISTRPSSQYNSYHSSVLPFGTWIELLKTAGFEIVVDRLFPDLQQFFSAQSTDWVVKHWAELDPFRDVAFGEPRYVLVKKGRPRLGSTARIRQLTDTSYRQEKRDQFNAASDVCCGINISYFQDFINARPLFDVIKRDRLRLLMRRGLLPRHYEELIQSYARRNGLKLFQFDKISEINVQELGIDAGIFFSESVVSAGHTLARQVVDALKLASVPTYLLQHGIWTEKFPERIVGSSSDTVVTWGAEHRDFLDSRHFLGEREVSNGCMASKNFFEMGAPKYSDVLIDDASHVLEARLGVKRSNYQSVVFVGTNHHWGKHQLAGDQIKSILDKTFINNPYNLFILKCHPAEHVALYSELNQHNVLVLDDTVLTCMDLPVTRLIASCDVVVGPLSTILLDGAIAGKKVIQYATENPLRFRGVQEVQPSITEGIEINSPSSSASAEFKNYYAGSVDKEFYRKFSELLVNRTNASSRSKAEGTDLEAIAVNYSLECNIEELWLESQMLARALNEERHSKDIRGELQKQLREAEESLLGAVRELETMKQQLESDRHQLAKTQEQLEGVKSTAWWKARQWMISVEREAKRLIGVKRSE